MQTRERQADRHCGPGRDLGGGGGQEGGEEGHGDGGRGGGGLSEEDKGEERGGRGLHARQGRDEESWEWCFSVKQTNKKIASIEHRQ